MTIARKDEFGRLVSPRFAFEHLKIAETPDEIETAEVRKRHRPTIGECRKWLEEYEVEFREWCDTNGIDESGLQSMLLCVLGFMTQRVSDAIRVLRCDPKWCRVRVDRLRQMGLWDGADRLGERFSAWVEESEGSGVQVLLDVMEIDGKIVSEVRDGKRFYLLPKQKVSE